MRGFISVGVALLCGTTYTHGQILQDFHFDDPFGTPLTQTVNSVPGGGSWIPAVEFEPDGVGIGGTITMGDGALRINRPPGTEQHAYLQLPETISSGLYRYIIDVREYNLVGTPNEIFRWSVLENRSPVQILAEARFERAADTVDPENPDGVMELSGVSFLTADGGTPIDPVPILTGRVQTEPVALMLELDMTNRKYELAYKIGATSTSSEAWIPFAQANLSTRNINFIRLTASNSFVTDETEFFDVDRAYFLEAPYGDANRDGGVTIADLGILAANWQRSGEDVRWHHGDFNRDGAVTIADLGILAANWQASVSGVSFEEALAMFDALEGVAVPEPGSLALLGLAGLTALRRRRY